MLLYKGTSQEFIQENQRDQIASMLKERFCNIFRFSPSDGEVLSWRNSLHQLASVLDKLGLHDHGILLEYQLPLTSKRLDCLIAGKDKNGNDHAVIIELKE